MSLPGTLSSKMATLAIRGNRIFLRWLGHAVATSFWLGAAFLFFMDLVFGPGVTASVPTLSPDGHYSLASSTRNPGAFGRAHTSFTLWREQGGRERIVYLDLVDVDPAHPIDAHWIDDHSAALINLPLANVRGIQRTAETSVARLIIRFKAD